MATPSWLRYSNQGATRSLPLSDDLVRAMGFLPELGIEMEVYSGGQPSEGPNRVGSHRHDHGNSGDVMFYKDGRLLDWNNQDDLPVLSDIVARARASGVTGIGAGNDYMGPGRVHIGFGAPAVWGAGGKSANAPEWLRTAYNGAPASASPGVAAINAASPMAAPQRPNTMAFAAPAPVMTAARPPQPQPNTPQSIMRRAFSNPGFAPQFTTEPGGRNSVMVRAASNGGGLGFINRPTGNSDRDTSRAIRMANSNEMRRVLGTGAITKDNLAEAQRRGARFVTRT